MKLAGFTTNDPALNQRGVVLLGKNALIHHELPRTARLPHQFPIAQVQVRTRFLEEVSFFCIRAGRCQKPGLFSGFYEPDGRFEPAGPVFLQSGAIVLRRLLLLDDLVLCRSELVQRYGLAEIRLGQPVEFLVALGDP